ncbi:hypothetical protein CFC21_049338 [Triticum aestivum]|uniref:Peptidase A1 domain-containing protein n=2 Tax=Triticum aestivum TaxID=4565 RepID=A0A9R1K3A2_WHEAT|nr:aspartic proteinase nepenthesin-1-like [Triticum aestivum]KAF7039322.1 hypothetical protein CFC21_049338 [Triticum aestivum]
MARPAAAVATVVALLLLQVPASPSVAEAAIGGRSPAAIPQLGYELWRKAAWSGPKAMIKQPFGAPDKDRLGSAAADNAGLVVYNLSVGYTREVSSGIVDIVTDFIWVPCPLSGFTEVYCATQTCRMALDKEDACGNSNGYTCRYAYQYGPVIGTTGYISAEEVTAVGTPITGRVLFGCSITSMVPFDGEFGVLGFSRGPYSLLSQLKISRFSYFMLPDDVDRPGSQSVVLLGDDAVPQTNSSLSTPLLRSKAYPDLYYVKLTGIMVDDKTLSGIPAGTFDLAANGCSGGVAMSTLSPITYFHPAAYNALTRALASKIKSQPVRAKARDVAELWLCYNIQSVANLTFPKITLVFDGVDGRPAPMELTTAHYFFRENSSGLQCLTMLPTPAGSPVGSVLGSLLQTGTHMIYDLRGGSLTFEKGGSPAASQKGGAAAPPTNPQVSLMVILALALLLV